MLHSRGRWFWIAGATGILAAAFVAAIVQRIGDQDSVLRDLEVLTRLKMPHGVSVQEVRDTRGGFLNQGFILRKLDVPLEATNQWLSRCPENFSRKTMSTSIILKHLSDSPNTDDAVTCVLNVESRSQKEIVVISHGRIVWMSFEI